MSGGAGFLPSTVGLSADVMVGLKSLVTFATVINFSHF